MAEDALDETLALLTAVPGGREVLAVLGEATHFGDAEVVSLHLDRQGGSKLTLWLPWKQCEFVFVFDNWMDVQLSGFSHQNVIGGMRLRRSLGRDAAPWERGVGFEAAQIEMELEPCFGANGTIRARLIRIEIQRVREDSRRPRQPSSGRP